MALSQDMIKDIEELLRTSLQKKFQNYSPETVSMPFHARLLGKDRLALYSFIHSLNTNFGTAIFEPIALLLAQKKFPDAASQIAPGNRISKKAQEVIQTIIDALAIASASPDKAGEIEKIRKVATYGDMVEVKTTKVDLMVKTKTGGIFYFDLKTAKPNAGNFKEFKRTLLEWVAVVLAENPDATISTGIAIPYNPYEPQKYNRWTMRGMLDLDKELKVAEDFWDFLGGKNTYTGLLDCFEKVGIEMRDEIDDYFGHFK